MNLLDVAIIVLLLTGIMMGVQRGFLRTTLDLVVLVTAAMAGALIYRPIGEQIANFLGLNGAPGYVLALVLGAMLVLGILNLLLSWTVIPHLSALRVNREIRMADSGLGLIPGFIYGLLFGAMMTVALGIVPIGESVDRAFAESDLATELRSAAQRATTGLAHRTGMDLADFTYVVVPEEDTSYRIPPNQQVNLEGDEQAEAEMFELVNQEREQRGLQRLTYDPSLVPVARAHSSEMLELGYFSHVSPNTGTFGDRMNASGLPFVQAGENLAYAPSVEVAHRGLMQSDGHRANILERRFDRMGIGAIRASDGSYMFTQIFAR